MVVLGGVHGCSGGGHAWLLQGGRGACMVAPWGVCGCSGGHVWLFRGCVWLLPGGMHGCFQGGMHGCSQGACVVAPRGACVVALGGMHGCSRGACVVAPGGACMVAPGGACVVALGGCMVAPGGLCGCYGGRAWDMTRYGDTVNERAVRILLECILVLSKIATQSSTWEDNRGRL